MRLFFFISAFLSFAVACVTYFVDHHWYGAVGWLLVSGHQLLDGLKHNHDN